MFDADAFVRSCLSATTSATPVDSVTEIVQSAVRAPTSIAKVLGTKMDQRMGILHASDDLVIQRAVFPRGYTTGLHEHRLWTVSGTYQGCERHELYRVDGEHLRPIGTEMAWPGEIQVLAPDIAHDVRADGDEHLCVLHVYLGNLFGTGAGEWDTADSSRRDFSDAWLERLLRDLSDADLIEPEPASSRPDPPRTPVP